MKWITKSGNIIDIKDMSENHLKNSIKMLKRQTSSWEKERRVYTDPFFHPQGEMAQLAVEQELEHNDKYYRQLKRATQELEKELNNKLK